MIASAADVALIVDVDGVIRDIAVGDGDARQELSGCWLGRRWIDTVTPESRASIEEMLGEVRANGVSRRHQVTHLSEQAGNLPVAYTAVRLGRSGHIAAIGRDVRIVNELQERLVEAQQALERDYVRMCHIETRYRQLFQLSSEAVVVVDRGSLRVAEGNPAAAVLLGLAPGSVVGRTFTAGMDAIGRRAVGDHLAAAGANGRAEPVRVSLADGRAVMLSASPIRQQGSELFLVRLRPDDEEAYAPNGAHNSRSLGLIDAAPDAFVVADREGRVLTANRAFLDLVQLTSLEQARGLPLGEWLGRPGADLPILLATLKEHGVVRLFSTAVRGQYGSTVEVELSAVASADPTGACAGFIIRNVGRRLAKGPQGAQDLACAIERLTGVVGRVSLHDLVRDTVDLVERHFVAAALELTHDNRTAAAQVLGVSRQSLYVKLRRYGLGPSASEQDAG